MEETKTTASIPRTEGELIPGSVKVWNVDKGYGFLKCDDNGDDIFIHQSAIKLSEAKFRAVLPGTAVIATYALRDGKPTCSSVAGLNDLPLAGFESKLAATQQIARASSAPGSLFGKVKWFNAEKGFGFIVPDNESEDVFVNIKDIENNTPLREGEGVQYVLAKQADNRDRASKVKPTDRDTAPVFNNAMAYNPYGGHVQPHQPHGATPFSPYGMGGPAAAPQHVSGGMKAGSIKWYNESRGFGFIIPANGGTEVYFRAAAVQGGAALTDGDPIEYAEKTAQGKSWAAEVHSMKNRKRKSPGGFDAPHGAYGDAPNMYKAQRQGPYGQLGERGEPRGPAQGNYDPYGPISQGPPGQQHGAGGPYGAPQGPGGPYDGGYGGPHGGPAGPGGPYGQASPGGPGPQGRGSNGGYEGNQQPSYYGGPPTYY